MRRNTAAIVVTLTALLASVPVALSAESPPALEADDCIEVLLEEFVRDARRIEAALRVDVRILDDTCGQTIQLVLLETPEGEVTSKALVADHESVVRQMTVLRDQNPDLPLTVLCKALELKTVREPEHGAGTLGRLLSDLRALRVTPVLEPLLVIHGVSYNLRIESGISEATFYFQAPVDRRPAAGPPHPLGRWAEDLRSVLGVTCPAGNLDSAGGVAAALDLP